MSDRLDELLDMALASGEIPSDATPGERAELAALLGAAGALRATTGDLSAEANASLPVARARFERFVAAGGNRASAPSSAPNVRWWQRRSQRTGLGAALVLAGVLAIAVIAGMRPFARNIESAAAVESGDFVQIEGTVESAEASGAGVVLRLTTAVGDFEVEVPGDASVSEGAEAADPTTIAAGRTILVAGTALGEAHIVASTITVSDLGPVRPEGQFDEVTEARPGLQGVVLSFALDRDGTHARVVIVTDGGERLLVVADPAAIRTLAQGAPSIIGLRIEVGERLGAGFGIVLVGEADPREQRFVTISGTVTGVERNLLTVATQRGAVTVAVRTETRILLAGGEEVGRPLVAAQRLEGRVISVSGGLARDGRIAADLIAVSGP